MNKNINDINSKIRNLEGVKNTKTYNAKEKDNIIVTKEKPKSRGGYSNNIGRINPSNNNFLNTPSRSNYNSNNFIKNFLPKNLNVNNNIPSSAKNNFRNRNREKDKEERERNSNPQTQYKRNKSLLIDQNSIDNNEQSDGNERINHFNNQSRITEEIEINSNNNIPFNNNSKDKSINEGHRKHRSLSQNKEFQNSDVDSSQINFKNKKLSPNNNKNQKKKIPFK